MSSLSNNLRDTNRRLGFWLDSVGAARGQSVITSPEQMAALLSELLRAGAQLRAASLPATEYDPDLESVLAQYRAFVEKLRDLMPAIHSELLGERARLEAQRSRMQSAAEWARASRQTL
jgi:hypothetical protein